jgi:hypothetical protein
MQVAQDTAHSVRELADREGVSLADVVCSALVIVLQHATQRSSLSFWTRFDNRIPPLNQFSFGAHSNAHVITVDVANVRCAKDIISSVVRATREGAVHQRIPLDLVWRSMNRCMERRSEQVLFEHVASGRPQGSGGYFLAQWPILDTDWRFALQCRSCEEQGELWMFATYLKDSFHHDRVSQLVREWCHVLRSLARAYTLEASGQEGEPLAHITLAPPSDCALCEHLLDGGAVS